MHWSLGPPLAVRGMTMPFELRVSRVVRRAVGPVVSMLLTLLIMLIALNYRSGEIRVERTVRPLYAVGDLRFRHALNSLFGPAIVPGNRVTALHNGDEIFPAMLDAIAAAQRSITFEIYIYLQGDIARRFSEALVERAKQGVRIHVLVDWLGSQAAIDPGYVTQMRKAGIQVELYRPLHWASLDRLNNRTHRRLLIVDGKVGFTGGVGIADRWLGDATNPEQWRDSQFRVEGPVVAQMQAAFILNWSKVASGLLHGDAYFPPLAVVGDADAQTITSRGGSVDESIRIMYLLAIASARRTIRIGNAYFVPDDVLIAQLVQARRRGVRVQILVPDEQIDLPIVRYASRGLWRPLLEAGVEIYEYRQTMYHAKVMVVDELFVSAGSTNFDNRSFQLNDEANLNVLHAPFGAAQAERFEADKRHASRITLKAWRERPWQERVWSALSLLIRSQL